MKRLYLVFFTVGFLLFFTYHVKAQTYGSLPVIEHFENKWVNGADTRDVPSLYWRNTPATGTNSWSRDDDGISRGAWGANTGLYSPAGANESSHSARFHCYNAPLGSTGSLDVFVNFSGTAGQKTLCYYYINIGGTDSLEVLLSSNGGASFTKINSQKTKSTWTKITVDLGSPSASNGIIRFTATSDHLASDIGLDEVLVYAGITPPALANFSANTVLGSAPLTVNFSDLSTGTPTSWKWDFNNDGIFESTAQNPSYTFNTAGSYSVKLVIDKAGVKDSIIKSNYILAKTFAPLPFLESFDNTWVNFANTRDVPSTYWVNTPATGDNSWSRNDDGGNRGAWINPFYFVWGANGTPHSARIHTTSMSTSTYGTLDANINFSSPAGNKLMSFWYLNETGRDSLKVYLSTDGGNTFGNALVSLGKLGVNEGTRIKINLGNVTTSTGTIRFKASGDNSSLYSDILIDEVNVGGLIADYTASTASGNAPLTVNFTDKSSGAPDSWKWDFNNDGVYESTSQNPSYTYTTGGAYLVKLVAGKGSNTDTVTNTIIQVHAYASLPFYESFENTWKNGAGTRDLPSQFWINSPAIGNNSWSRDDDGIDWTDKGGGYMPSGANETSHSARFHSSNTSLTGTLDMSINFSTLAGNKLLSFWYNNPSGTDNLNVYLSTNGGANFGSALTTLTNTTGWTKYVINLGNVTSSSGVIRFVAGGYNNTDIGLDEVKIGSLAANFTTDVTYGMAPFTVNFTDQSMGTPDSWKWDFNNDGVFESTQQNPSYTFNNASYYTVKLVIAKGGVTDTIIRNSLVKVNGYASLPFAENFENNWINKDDLRDVPSIIWKNTPATGDNSWSRDDDGIDRGAWTSSNNVYGLYFPQGANGTYRSARFHSYGTANSGTMDVNINFSTQTGNKSLSFWYINTDGTDSLKIYLSTNGGTDFGNPVLKLNTATEWTRVVINLGNVTSSTGVIRFLANGEMYTSDIGIDEIKIGGVIANFTSDVTSGLSPLTVHFTDQSTGSPTSWKWDFNNDGIVESTQQNPVYTFTNAGSYKVKLFVSNANSSDSIITKNYRAKGYATLPCYENFENTWVSNDDVRDVPSTYWINDPATGDNSWSRDDDGLARGAWYDNFSSYDPTGANTTSHSARFHSWDVHLGTTGKLDFEVNFSTATANTPLTFWYINTGGTDSLKVYLSANGGTNFGPALIKLSVAASWTKYTIDLGNVTSATGVIRFLAIGDYANSDIGLDEIRVGMASNQKDIVAYTVPNQVSNSVINATSHTISVKVPLSYDLTQVASTFTLSGGASAKIGTTTQVSGTTVNDFTNMLTYTITADDGSTQNWTVSITKSSAIDDVISENSVTAYPNPSGGLFHLKLHTPGNIQIKVFNTAGSLILNRLMEASADQVMPLEMSKFPAGIYLLQVIRNEKITQLKLVKE